MAPLAAALLVVLASPIATLAQDTDSGTLVDINSDNADFLAKAQKLIEQKDYAEGVRILYLLVTKAKTSFVPSGSADTPDLYVGLSVKINEVIAKLPPEAMKAYRDRCDAEARTLYQQALKTSNVPALRQVALRYLNTSVGPEVLNTLANLHFDQAKFSQAAAFYQQYLQLEAVKDVDRPLALAKKAVAHHFAGEAAQQQAALAELKLKHPDAMSLLGGREQNVVTFVETMVQMSPASIPSIGTSKPLKNTWLGWGGNPTGTATMEDCNVILVPRWNFGGDNSAALGSVPDGLIAGRSCYAGVNPNTGYQLKITGEFLGGHITVKWVLSNNPGNPIKVPGLVHPVVVGDTVIVRTDDTVKALDAVTGTFKWQVDGPKMAMERDISLGQNHGYPPQGADFSDMGRYTVSAGGDLLFVVGNFCPNIPNYGRVTNDKTDISDSSVLIAASISAEGRMKWSSEESTNDMVKGAKFLTAPTYKSGRVYAIVKYIEAYHLICLNAETGAFRWSTAISSKPPSDDRSGYNFTSPDLGSPPAVADGRVFVLTNAGVIGCFDAENGQPLWAYQYASRRPGTSYEDFMKPRANRGANPIIVTGGKVIFLPADPGCNDLICVSFEDGRPVWRQGRQEQDDLSYIDAKRLLLSGRGLLVLSVDTGETITGQSDLGVMGRPAVTEKNVFASALDGRLIRMGLATYERHEMSLAGDGVLGNLVSVGGTLIAANSLGVSAYFSFEDAYERLSDRIAAEPRGAGANYFERAKLCFGAQQYDNAIKDLQQADKLTKDEFLRQRIEGWFYRTYVARGNNSENMERDFLQALKYAAGNQDKGHMLLRLAMCYENAHQYDKALDTCQKIMDSLGDEDLWADLKVGPDADDESRIPDNALYQPARQLAGELVARIVATPEGRQAYAAIDAKAKTEYDQAQAAHDPKALISVSERYPNSIWADPALFAAAEEYFALASKQQGDLAEETLGYVIQYLSELCNKPQSQMRIPATVGLAYVYAKRGMPTVAALTIEPIRDQDPTQAIKFADYQATLEQAIEDITQERITSESDDGATLKSTAWLTLPLERKWVLSGDNQMIVTDQDHNPVQIGEKLLVLQPDRLILLDTNAKDEGSAITWSAVHSLDLNMIAGSQGGSGAQLVGTLSKDGSVVAVCDRANLIGLDLKTAKVAWRKTMNDLGANTAQFMASGMGQLILYDYDGKFLAINVKTGDVTWKSEVPTSGKLVAAPRVMGKLMACRFNNFNSVGVWNIENGKLLKTWEGQQADINLTPSGLVVVMWGGKLTAYDPKMPDKPLWERVYDVAQSPRMLGISNDYVAVATNCQANTVEVIAMTTGKLNNSLKCAQLSQFPGLPQTGTFDGTNLYVTCSMMWAGGNPDRVVEHRGLGVQAFDLKKRQEGPVWTQEIDLNQNTNYSLTAPRVVRKHLVVSLTLTRNYNTNQEMPYHYVLNLSDGQVAHRVECKQNNDYRWRNAVFVTNNRLTYQDKEGVTVYGGR